MNYSETSTEYVETVRHGETIVMQVPIEARPRVNVYEQQIEKNTHERHVITGVTVLAVLVVVAVLMLLYGVIPV